MKTGLLLLLRCVILLMLLMLLAGAAAAAAWWYMHRPLELQPPVIDFTVERGFSMRQAARAIADAGVDVWPEALYWSARLSGRADRIVAGSYEARSGTTPWELIVKMVNGDVSQGQLRLIEGWHFRQLRAEIESHPDLLQDTLDLSDAEILQRVGSSYTHPEGLFFPDTYLFNKRSSALALFRHAYQRMEKRLNEAWQMRNAELPLDSPYEALTLASIIEKETGREDERDRVASVFINRLRLGMRLQTDPTVIYGAGELQDGRLRRRHLDADHEYNTYTRVGLPPTPIAMPGWASLQAAVRPADTRYLYFVARGDGSSEFSQTLAEHNRAVNRYQRGKGG